MNHINIDTVIFITGCSSGFGKELAINAAKRGCQVIATAREIEQLAYLDNYSNVLCLTLDIVCKSSIAKAVAEVRARYKKIDILINNAGINYRAEILDIEDEKMRKIFEVNIIGTIQMTQAVLPMMRAQKSGVIANISSGSGFYSTYHTCCYSISKYAMEGISANLRMSESVHESNIKILTVNPGVFKTDILKKSLEHGEKIFNNPEDYSFMDGNTAEAAEVILNALDQENPPTRLILGADAMAKFNETVTLMRQEQKINSFFTINKIHKRSRIQRCLYRAKIIINRALEALHIK